MTEYTHPEIKTALPGPKGQEIIDRDVKHMSTSCYREYPLVIDHGKGVWVWDVDGNRYMDLMAGIAVTSTGHSHPEVVKAITDHAEKFLHICSMDFYFDLQARFAERLADKTQIKGNGNNRVFFANSGAEAWEGAVKLAHFKTRRDNVICFYGAFHGRTLAAISANASKTRQRSRFGPLAPGFYHSFYPNPMAPDKDMPYTTEACIAFLKNYIFGKMVSPDEVAAIVMEPIQGEGGYIVPPKEFVQEIRKICDEHGILLIADEIQSGFGRTGKFFAMENFDVKPDIVCVAKGIASGLPLSAFIANENVMDWPIAVHGSTFGGNPVAMAAASKTLDLVEAGMMENAGVIGSLILDRLKAMQKKYDFIYDVRGIGLMIGIEFARNGKLDGALREDIIQKSFLKGLLFLGCGTSTIRICPALNITADQANVAMDIFEEVLKGI
jgi:4-aminobutyrate aminotransferase